MPLPHVHLGHGLGHRHADAHALVVGQRDDAADSPAVLAADQRHRGAERHRQAFPQGQEAPGVLGQRAAQIVMARKQPPRTAPATKDLKLDRRSPKTPPGERGRGHVDHPVRRQPLGHVVVAGDGHEAAADLARADSLGNRRRHHPGHVAIDHAGELVENDEDRVEDEDRGRIRIVDSRHPSSDSVSGQCPGQVAAELLAVAEHAGTA